MNNKNAKKSYLLMGNHKKGGNATMRKQQFYVVLGSEAPKRETWQGSLQEAYENGVEPLDYEETTVEDQNGNKVTDVVLLRFAERWKGAAHRYLKKNGFEYLKSQHEGLNMYG